MNSRCISPISFAPHYLGITISTLHRWEKKGQFIPYRTIGNHRRYTKIQIEEVYVIYDDEPSLENNESYRIPYFYARVSTARQESACFFCRIIISII